MKTTPLLTPPDYNKDIILYLAASELTIGMVLVQEDDLWKEHVAYYLSKSIVYSKIYSYVEKLALVVLYDI